MKVMVRGAILLLIAMGAILVLGVGCFLGQSVWRSTHHRYDRPNTGSYYGAVSAWFTWTGDTVYTFSFKGRTQSRWYWTYPTNFTYSALEIEWQGEGSKGAATLQLPAFAYQSSNTTGVLTKAVLAEWLVGNTYAASAKDLSGVDLIYRYVDAAGRGSLPPPNHHGYSFDDPMMGHIQHFLVGCGVGWPVYVWSAVWLAAVICAAPWIWNKCKASRPSH